MCDLEESSLGYIFSALGIHLKTLTKQDWLHDNQESMKLMLGRIASQLFDLSDR